MTRFDHTRAKNICIHIFLPLKTYHKQCWKVKNQMREKNDNTIYAKQKINNL